MLGPKKVEPRSVRHGSGNGHNALVFIGQLGKRVREYLSVSGNAGRGVAGLRIVGAEAMEFFLSVERRLESAALLRQHVQQHWVIDGLEEFECLDEQRQIVAVDGAEVFQPELFKQN